MRLPGNLTNAVAIAAGYAHSVAATEDGQLRQWGEYGALGTFVPLVDPPSGSNYVAVAAGMEHDLALRADGTVVAWGLTNASANYVPTDLAPAKAIACGWDHSLALLTNGIVAAWGQAPMTNVPAGLSNVTAISANVFHSLALRGDGTVVAWGYDLAGETAVPPGLSNIVDIAAGATHNLALRADGTVCAWGDNSFGQTNVPAGLSNVMAVAAGFGHSVALKNDGTLVAWGDDEYGQTDVPITLTNGPVKLIAAGGQQTVAVLYSPLVQYPVDVTKDLLLIYNTNSLDSSNVCAYYLQHRPMVGGANVLGIGCTTNETFLPDEYTNVFAAQVQSWLAGNPTKRPQYVILFPDIPSRVNTNNTPGQYDESWYGPRYSVQ